eukprot:1475714-Prymnesium_polylepis.1
MLTKRGCSSGLSTSSTYVHAWYSKACTHPKVSLLVRATTYVGRAFMHTPYRYSTVPVMLRKHDAFLPVLVSARALSGESPLVVVQLGLLYVPVRFALTNTQ